MLLTLLRIAIRNLRRNTRRSIITACGLAVGAFVIVYGRGLVNGLQDAMIHGITETRLGDVQVHRTGYLDGVEAFPLDRAFALDDRFHALIAADKRITDVSGRIHFSGLVSAGEMTSLFFGLGVDPAHEYRICRFQKENILEGEPVRADRPHHVVVGKPLADAMGLKVGSELTIVSHTRLGGLNATDLTVAGVIEYKLPGPGSRVIQMPLHTAQRLLYMDGLVTEAILNVSTLPQVPAVEKALASRLRREYKDLDLASNTWMDVGQQFNRMIDEQEEVLGYIIAVMYIMMMSAVANTSMLSVFERTREIGTMMAVGLRRQRILSLILLEAAVVGISGAMLGVGLGAGVVKALELYGLPIFPIGNATQWYRIYPRIPLSYLAWVTAVAMVTGAIAALYPAWRASRLRPAQALSDH